MSTEKVFQAISIRNTVIANRVVRTAHGTNFGKGHVTSELIAYHKLAADAGVGLSILENASVHPSGPGTLHIFDDSVIADYKVLMHELSASDMKVFQQLGHLGYEVRPLNGDAPWSASDLSGPGLGVKATAITQFQIDELISSFSAAAIRCERGGLHGVEIHAAHGHLIQQFLSAETNLRDDPYGGEFKNRIRLLKQILESIRNSVSDDFVVGVRLGAEARSEGMSPADIAEVVDFLQQHNCVDYISLSYGSVHTLEKIMGTMYETAGYELPAASLVKEIARVPVIVTGRIRTIAEANEVLQSGLADLVGMTRAHIADPEIINKTRENNLQQIRPCIATNQGCVAGIARGRMACMVNPVVGRESEINKLMLPAAIQKRILVIGAGPAGMEVARVAAIRGHDVTIMESKAYCGGALQTASRFPNTALFEDFIEWQANELARLAVDIKYGVTVNAREAEDHAADEIIIATGAQNAFPENIAGVDKKNVLFVEQLLSHSSTFSGHKVAVYDETGRYQSIAACERLLESGAHVTYITNRNRFASRMTASLVSIAALKRFAEKSFECHLDRQLKVVRDNAVIVKSLIDGVETKFDVDWLILACEDKSRNELLKELKLPSSAIHIIGDADKVGDLQSAIKQGFEAALRL